MHGFIFCHYFGIVCLPFVQVSGEKNLSNYFGLNLAFDKNFYQIVYSKSEL